MPVCHTKNSGQKGRERSLSLCTPPACWLGVVGCQGRSAWKGFSTPAPQPQFLVPQADAQLRAGSWLQSPGRLSWVTEVEEQSPSPPRPETAQLWVPCTAEALLPHPSVMRSECMQMHVHLHMHDWPLLLTALVGGCHSPPPPLCCRHCWQHPWAIAECSWPPLLLPVANVGGR